MAKESTQLVQSSKIQNIRAVEELQKKYSLSTLQAGGTLERAVMIAEGIQSIRLAVMPLLGTFMPLMNNPLGFDTDKNPSKTGKNETYPAEVIVDCLVEALMRGLRIAGNEFNILVGKCYTTKFGYERLVKELPGITDLDSALSPPFLQGGHTCVKVRATWKLNGMVMGLKDTNGNPYAIYAIRVNTGQGIDATLGKATRRMYKAIYELCTGTQFTEPNVDEETALLAAPTGPDVAATQTEAVTKQIEAEQQKANGIHPDQITKLEQLKAKIKPPEFNVVLMRRGKGDIKSLTRAEADDCIQELLPLADDSVNEPSS